MNQNRDWKPIIMLALAGMAIFIIARGARGGGDNGQAGTSPQMVIVQPAQQLGATVGVAPAPVVVIPAQAQAPQTDVRHTHGHWGGGGPFFIFPLFFLAGLAFLAYRMFGNNGRGWGGPGGWGGSPRPGQQGHTNVEPQHSQGQHTQRIDADGDITRPEERRDY